MGFFMRPDSVAEHAPDSEMCLALSKLCKAAKDWHQSQHFPEPPDERGIQMSGSPGSAQ